MNPTRKLTDQQKIDIVYQYALNKLSVTELAKIYPVTHQAIQSILKVRGIKMRNNDKKTFNLNENYFNKINTEDKAYFLGFLYADGNLRNNRSTMSISLQEEDSYILNTFKDFLEYEGSIKYIPPPKKFPHRKSQRCLRVSNERLCDNLKILGCVPKKSLILKFPTEDQVPSHLIRHFIRGYFDGDGCVNHNRPIQITICSSFIFCEVLKTIIVNDLKINCNTHKVKGAKDSFGILKICGRFQVLSFLDWIYKDATLFLTRKHKRYQKIKETENKIKI